MTKNLIDLLDTNVNLDKLPKEIQFKSTKKFTKPEKKINNAENLKIFKNTVAYYRLSYFIIFLCQKVSGKLCPSTMYNNDLCFNPNNNNNDSNQNIHLENNNKLLNNSTKILLKVLNILSNLIDQTPLKPGIHRYGNPAYRDWLQKVDSMLSDLILPIFTINNIQSNADANNNDNFNNQCNTNSILKEVGYYFLNSFGSPERLDYGTGHELNFIAFYGSIIFIHINNTTNNITGEEILFLFKKYFNLVRKLILTFKLEPAGSHGVWGLDDYFHLPYILGAAQLGAFQDDNIPKPDIPKPSDILNKQLVSKYQEKYLYFNAIFFINKVKNGPFFAHSSILYDISAVPSWSKIYKGMIKMYDAEVLAKFPVVQHLYFGLYFYPWIEVK